MRGETERPVIPEKSCEPEPLQRKPSSVGGGGDGAVGGEGGARSSPHFGPDPSSTPPLPRSDHGPRRVGAGGLHLVVLVGGDELEADQA
mgnify:CR=1 FL=1